MKMKCRVRVKEIRTRPIVTFFKNLQKGDVVEFSVDTRGVGGYIDCKNLRTNEEDYLSFNQVDRCISGVFEFEEVQ